MSLFSFLKKNCCDKNINIKEENSDMSMFCYQCQEASKNTGCTVAGMCGKKADTAKLQDELVLALKCLSVNSEGKVTDEIGEFICEALFATITNGNFDNDSFKCYIDEAKAKSKKLSKADCCCGSLSI